MKQYPDVPTVADAPDALFERGHLWIQELVDGEQLRFRLCDSGAVQFGDRTRAFDPDAIPPRFGHAVRHVREHLDRETLRAAVDDVESVVFFGVATHRQSVEYDWTRTPSVLGFDVWSGERDGFLPPDAVEAAVRRLGLDPVNAFRKELRAVDFDPSDYEIPASNWYDGPAVGVILRNKTGQRASLRNPDVEAEAADDIEASASELARRYVTRDRVDRAVRSLEAVGRSTTFDAVFERVVESVFRERHDAVRDAEETVGGHEFRSEAAARVRQHVDERRDGE